jgi:hypothetical protein
MKVKHGQAYNGAQTPEYDAWRGMIQRCTNPNNKQWKDYGGRGITVCKAWLKSFEAFFKCLGKRPKGKTLDRKNNNGDYKPSNVRWATRKEQRANQRPRVAKTHCPQGHAFTKTNTYINPKGRKVCRICNAEAGVRWESKRRKVVVC